MNNIDYKILHNAIEFYKDLGYEYIEVPWVVDKEFDDATRPKEKKPINVDIWDKRMIGSGEQSFLSIFDTLEEDKKYMCVTPCFRDEEEDELHSRYFIKLELFSKSWENIRADARLFYSTYISNTKLLQYEKNEDGVVDIVYDDIELGSYGSRTVNLGFKSYSYHYGTGLAEPRFSTILSKLPKGYHDIPIQKFEVGDIKKLKEELDEVLDANSSDNPIMELVELSDLYGAIKIYLWKKYGNNLNMKDLEKMSDVTVRSFRNGRR